MANGGDMGDAADSALTIEQMLSMRSWLARNWRNTATIVSLTSCIPQHPAKAKRSQTPVTKTPPAAPNPRFPRPRPHPF